MGNETRLKLRMETGVFDVVYRPRNMAIIGDEDSAFHYMSCQVDDTNKLEAIGKTFDECAKRMKRNIRKFLYDE